MEQPLRALKASIERLKEKSAPPPRPQLSPKAKHLIVFIVTDEDERSPDPKNATRATEVVEIFKTAFPAKQMRAFTMVVKNKACYQQQEQQAAGVYISYGERVAALSSLTGGSSISLCEEDYGQVFEKVSKTIKTVITGFQLKQRVIAPKMVRVQFVTGKPVPWRLEGQNIVFDVAPERGSDIRVHYYIEDARYKGLKIKQS